MTAAEATAWEDTAMLWLELETPPETGNEADGWEDGWPHEPDDYWPVSDR